MSLLRLLLFFIAILASGIFFEVLAISTGYGDLAGLEFTRARLHQHDTLLTSRLGVDIFSFYMIFFAWKNPWRKT